MGKGDRPAISLTYRRKDAPRGTKGEKIMAAWPGNYPDSFNATFDVKEIVLKDGTVLDVTKCWFDLRVWGQARRDEPPPPQDEPEEGKEWNGTDPLPF